MQTISVQNPSPPRIPNVVAAAAILAVMFLSCTFSAFAQVNVLTQHTEQIHDLAWGELDSRPVLISASADGTISLSDALTGDLQSSIAVAAETITSVNVNGHTLLVASSTSETRIIDVTRERILSRIPHSGTPAAKGSAVALATGGKHGLQPRLALLDLSAYRDSAQ